MIPPRLETQEGKAVVYNEGLYLSHRNKVGLAHRGRENCCMTSGSMYKSLPTWHKAGFDKVNRSRFFLGVYSKCKKIWPPRDSIPQPRFTHLQIRIIHGIEQKHSTSTTLSTPYQNGNNNLKKEANTAKKTHPLRGRDQRFFLDTRQRRPKTSN
jgi:hypothetical protein